MKSWIKFRNWSIALIGFELFLLVFCWLYARQLLLERSEERRVGKECRL